MHQLKRPSPAARPHRNHGLFSDHYLDVTLPERPGWESLMEQARPAMEEISSLFDSYTPSDNEAQTKEGLVRPVLRILGHDVEVQPALETPTVRSVPTTSSTATLPR